MPDNPAGADSVLLEAIERLGADYQLDKLQLLYLQGKSTQIPAQVKVTTSKRFTRKITIGTQGVNVAWAYHL